VLILPANRELAIDEKAGVPEQSVLRVARSNSLGSVLVTALLLVLDTGGGVFFYPSGALEVHQRIAAVLRR
jgi:hypothetical protein